MASGSSSSGPSSIDSQLSRKLPTPESTPSKLDKPGSPTLYDDSLVVIERSNQVPFFPTFCFYLLSTELSRVEQFCLITLNSLMSRLFN